MHKAPPLLLCLVILFCSCKNKQKDQPAVVHDTSYVKTDTAGNDSNGQKESLTDLASREFMKYRSKVENKETIVDSFYVHVGDFTSDGVDDALIVYILVPNAGNAIIDERMLLYEGNKEGTALKFISDHSPGYPFTFNKIKDHRIYIVKDEYAPDDPRCCPSIHTGRSLRLEGSKVIDEEEVDKD